MAPISNLPGGHAPGDELCFHGWNHTFPNGDKLERGQWGEVVWGDEGWLAMQFPGNKHVVSVRLEFLGTVDPPPLPGGHAMGERLCYNGWNHTLPGDDKLERGQWGEVVGENKGELVMQFPGNKGPVYLRLELLGTVDPPPLPGGHAMGERLCYNGWNHTVPNGDDKLERGQWGEVVGEDEGKLVMQFPGNKGLVSVHLERLGTVDPPPLPGGHAMGERLCFHGWNHTLPGDDKLERGQWGEVVGENKGELVMQFPGNKGPVYLHLERLGTVDPPPLPGGHAMGERLCYNGWNHTLPNGDKLERGQWLLPSPRLHNKQNVASMLVPHLAARSPGPLIAPVIAPTAPARPWAAAQPPRASAEHYCHLLGEAILCTEDECSEATVFLCAQPSEDPNVTCVLQEGLLMDGKPAYACRHEPRGDVRMSSGPSSVDVSDLGVTMTDLETPIPGGGDGGSITSSGWQSTSAVADDDGILWEESAEAVVATLLIPGLRGQPSAAVALELTETTATVTVFGMAVWSCVLLVEIERDHPATRVEVRDGADSVPVVELTVRKRPGSPRWGGLLSSVGEDAILR